MASAREMRLRIRSVDNIAQVTRALQAVSASRVRKAEALVRATRPYADKAWQVLRHLALQPARGAIHPLLTERQEVRRILVLLITGDRGLAGAYNSNAVRFAQETFRNVEAQVSYVVIGRKGRDMMARRNVDIMAEFSDLPAQPTFADVSAIGRLAIEEFLEGRADEVSLVFTDFINMLVQVPRRKKLLPLEFEEIPSSELGGTFSVQAQPSAGPKPAYIYEPSQPALVDRIVPRLTELQVYQAMLESNASEHAARMVAMRNATQNAEELSDLLQLVYNKARQQAITGDMLDIAGGAEALAQSTGQ